MYEIIGLITVVIGVGIHVPYLIQTIKREIKPHPFTWILWTLITIVIFFAQLLDGAGPGAWGTGAVGFLCIFITISTIRNGFDNVRKMDIILFCIGLCSIPLWLLTRDPTLSVIIVVGIDVVASIPTFRKSYLKPYDEPIYLYSINVLRHLLSFFAIMNITIATILFPVVIGIMNGLLMIFLICRRRVIAKPLTK